MTRSRPSSPGCRVIFGITPKSFHSNASRSIRRRTSNSRFTVATLMHSLLAFLRLLLDPPPKNITGDHLLVHLGEIRLTQCGVEQEAIQPILVIGHSFRLRLMLA